MPRGDRESLSDKELRLISAMMEKVLSNLNRDPLEEFVKEVQREDGKGK